MHQTFGKLLAKGWLDREFYESFVEDPIKVLKEAGVNLDQSENFIVRENQTQSGIEVVNGVLAIALQPPPWHLPGSDPNYGPIAFFCVGRGCCT